MYSVPDEVEHHHTRAHGNNDGAAAADDDDDDDCGGGDDDDTVCFHVVVRALDVSVVVVARVVPVNPLLVRVPVFVPVRLPLLRRR